MAWILPELVYILIKIEAKTHPVRSFERAPPAEPKCSTAHISALQRECKMWRRFRCVFNWNNVILLFKLIEWFACFPFGSFSHFASRIKGIFVFDLLMQRNNEPNGNRIKLKTSRNWQIIAGNAKRKTDTLASSKKLWAKKRSINKYLQLTFSVTVVSRRWPSGMARFHTTHRYFAPSSSFCGVIDNVLVVWRSLDPPRLIGACTGIVLPSRYQLK